VPERSAALLEEAIHGFDANGMALHTACARRRLGALAVARRTRR
jgi:hypothetical protein